MRNEFLACEQVATQIQYELAAYDATTLYGSTESVDRFMLSVGLESGTALASSIGISNEGVVSWIVSKFSVLLHHLNIVVNRVFATLTFASKEVKEAIAEAARQGDGHNISLPISKSGMVVGAAAIAAAALGISKLRAYMKSGKNDPAEVNRIVAEVQSSAAADRETLNKSGIDTKHLDDEEVETIKRAKEANEAKLKEDKKKSQDEVADFKTRWVATKNDPEARAKLVREREGISESSGSSAPTQAEKVLTEVGKLNKEAKEVLEILKSAGNNTDASKEDLAKAVQVSTAMTKISAVGTSGATRAAGAFKRGKRKKTRAKMTTVKR